MFRDDNLFYKEYSANFDEILRFDFNLSVPFFFQELHIWLSDQRLRKRAARFFKKEFEDAVEADDMLVEVSDEEEKKNTE